jgi:hypothetical protein
VISDAVDVRHTLKRTGNRIKYCVGRGKEKAPEVLWQVCSSSSSSSIAIQRMLWPGKVTAKVKVKLSMRLTN